jgi:predicted 2-oxoglutarate/Fe(II)-dependent dioxygenase YbiX
MAGTRARTPARRPPPGFGEILPFFAAETDGIASYSLDVAAGRWIVLMVFHSLGDPTAAAAHAVVTARAALFNDADAAFYGLSTDLDDRFQRGLANAAVGRRYFWDFERKAAPLFGEAPCVFLVDRSFRVVMAEPLDRIAAVLDRLEHELAGEPSPEGVLHAPFLMLPRAFEPEFCETLIAYFRSQEPEVSGFAATVEGRTVHVVDALFKRRTDVTLGDETLLAAVREKLRLRLFPAVKQAFNWQATQIERFLLCRYGETDAGFFSAHRDDATAGTAHRKFAVTINLNAGDYEGGALRFPEFGRRTYAPPTGGAAVFCCSLLHEVTPVTAGERFAFVPFLYDEDGERIRRRNLALVGERGKPPKFRR